MSRIVITLTQAKETDYGISDSDPVHIFSGEHDAYWRPEGEGYTADLDGAGVWSMRQAYEMTKHCGPEKQIEFHHPI